MPATFDRIVDHGGISVAVFMTSRTTVVSSACVSGSGVISGVTSQPSRSTQLSTDSSIERSRTLTTLFPASPPSGGKNVSSEPWKNTIGTARPPPHAGTCSGAIRVAATLAAAVTTSLGGAGQVVYEEGPIGDPDDVDTAAVDPRVRGQLVHEVRNEPQVVDLLHHRVRAAHQAPGVPVAKSCGGVGDDDPGLVRDVVQAADVPKLGGAAERPVERQEERQVPIGGPAGWHVQLVGALEPAGEDRSREITGAGNRIRSRVRGTAGSGLASQQNRGGNGEKSLAKR